MLSVHPDDIDAHNTEVLAEDPERNLDVLAERIETGAADYIEVAGSFDEHDVIELFTGVKVPPSGITATLLGEALVHGSTSPGPRVCRGRSNRLTRSSPWKV